MTTTSSERTSPEREYGKLYPVAKALLRPCNGFLWHIRVRGREHLPRRGGAIIAANHISFLDSVFLMTVLPRRITFVGKAEYLDDWKTKYLFPNVGMIPIDRSGGDASRAALDAASQVLRRRELFGIFPEGTRSRSGKLYRGRTGVARLALDCGVPIVPAGIVGTDRIQPPDAKLPRLFQRCSITFGRPIDATRYAERAHDPRVARLLTDEVMFELRELTGQDYVDEYATKARAVRSSERDAGCPDRGRVRHRDREPTRCQGRSLSTAP
jgi:1-acyl-sn-glycerol-3-phosphate acyltransferase